MNNYKELHMFDLSEKIKQLISPPSTLIAKNTVH